MGEIVGEVWISLSGLFFIRHTTISVTFHVSNTGQHRYERLPGDTVWKCIVLPAFWDKCGRSKQLQTLLLSDKVNTNKLVLYQRNPAFMPYLHLALTWDVTIQITHPDTNHPLTPGVNKVKRRNLVLGCTLCATLQVEAARMTLCTWNDTRQCIFKLCKFSYYEHYSDYLKKNVDTTNS